LNSSAATIAAAWESCSRLPTGKELILTVSPKCAACKGKGKGCVSFALC
jgi:hypothetical protein